MSVDRDELDVRLAEVADDAARAETMLPRDYLLVGLFTLALPAVLLVVGWYL